MASTRIVCLPGAYHTPEDFLSAGFADGVRERRLSIDLQFVDLEPQHLGDRRGLDRLKYEIVLPARALGCRSLWLAGISLGGYIALDFVTSNPGSVDGLCLLAPYLGNRKLTAEIASAPGLNAWLKSEFADSHDERRIWRFLQTRNTRSPLMHLGFGLDDRFAEAHRLLAQALPPDEVDVVPGGHDWRTWTTLWEHFLDTRFA